MLPELATQVEAFLRIEPLSFANISQPMATGHAIGTYQHLMQRVDVKQLDALFEAPAQVEQAPEAIKHVAPGGEELAPTIGIDDFAKIDLRIAKILSCTAVAGSTKLLQLTLDAGEVDGPVSPKPAMCSAALPPC